MRTLLVVITVAALGAALLLAFREAPALDGPLGGVAQIYVLRTAAETTATNVVAAINFDWRAYDTLGEATILLSAVTGVAALLRFYLERRRETGIT
jgi:multisubunit Na+/H+ antiporter MnhB subunit